MHCGDRLLAALSATLGSKIHVLNTSEDGAINFSTKHTAVDEDGEPEKKGKLFYSHVMITVAN